MVLFAGIAGWKTGPFLVSPLAALLGLILMYQLARQFGLSRPYALTACLLLAAYPLYLFIALQPMSDVLATLWVMTAVLAAMRSRKKKAWAILSGAAFGISVLVRPLNALILLPLLSALPWSPAVLGLFALSGLPFAIFMGAANNALYGSPLTTGYRGEISANLAWRYFPARFQFYGHWLSASLTPIIPLAWLGMPADRRQSVKDRLLLFLWFAPLFLFYCFYAPYQGWWFLRFFLPSLPALILSALLVIRDGSEALKYRLHTDRPWTRGLNVIAAALIAVVLIGEVRQIKKLGVPETDKFESVYKNSCLTVRETLPAKSVILSMFLGGAITYYTNFIPCRWDSVNPDSFRVLRRRVESCGYRWYALLFPFEEEQFQARAPGAWEKIRNIDFVSLWRLVPEARPQRLKRRGKKPRNKPAGGVLRRQDLGTFSESLE